MIIPANLKAPKPRGKPPSGHRGLLTTSSHGLGSLGFSRGSGLRVESRLMATGHLGLLRGGAFSLKLRRALGALGVKYRTVGL